MAKSINNDATFGLSGRFGKMISFRQIAGETEACRRPGKRTKPPTPGQLSQQDRFLIATYYGKTVMADPVKKAVYQEKAAGRKSAYNLALSDAIKAPVIHYINTDNYHRLAGDTLLIRAVDDFKVTLVTVSFYSLGGSLIEQGNAVAQPGGVDWSYTIVNAMPASVKISAAAFDLPGNKTVMEITTQ
jgi:hypothetical protein